MKSIKLFLLILITNYSYTALERIKDFPLDILHIVAAFANEKTSSFKAESGAKFTVLPNGLIATVHDSGGPMPLIKTYQGSTLINALKVGQKQITAIAALSTGDLVIATEEKVAPRAPRARRGIVRDFDYEPIYIRNIQLYDITGFKKTIGGTSGKVTDFYELPDGTLGMVIYNRLKSLELDKNILECDSEINQIKTLDNLIFAVLKEDGQLIVKDINSDTQIQHNLDGLNCICPINDKVSAAGFNDGQIGIISNQTGRTKCLLASHASAVNDIIVFNNKLISISDDKTVKIFNNSFDEIETEFKFKSAVKQIKIINNQELALQLGSGKIVTIRYIGGSVLKSIIYSTAKKEPKKRIKLDN